VRRRKFSLITFSDDKNIFNIDQTQTADAS